MLNFFLRHRKRKFSMHGQGEKRRRQKQKDFLSPDLGEDFFQNSGTLGIQPSTDFFNLLRENFCILRTKKTKCRLQIWEQINKYISKKIPGGWLQSGRFTHQTENLNSSLIRVPEIATGVNPFLMLFYGKGDDYPMCHAKGMTFVGSVGHLTALTRREALVRIPDLSHQAQNFPWVRWACLNSC